MTDTDMTFRPAILLDWDSFCPNGGLNAEKIDALSKLCKVYDIVVLVTYPDFNDYYTQESFTLLPKEPVAVLRNTGFKRDLEFKKKAYEIMRDASLSIPVAFYDLNYTAANFYYGEGLIDWGFPRG